MANFIITTQKPTSSELQASKPKTAGKGMEDAFDSLMTHKEVHSSRQVGEQDRHRGQDRHQQQQQTKEHDAKRHRDAYQANHARQIAAQVPRHLAHHAQAMSLAPEQLIQRRSQGGQSDQQGDQEQQRRQHQEAQAVQGKIEKPGLSEHQSLRDQPDEELGSLFDDIDSQLGVQDEPAPLADDASIFDMLEGDEPRVTRSTESDSAKERPASSTKTLNVPGEEAAQLDQATGVPLQSAEEDQILAAAMAKNKDHYPDGSVGRALQDGKLSQEALNKLFAQWKAQRDAKNHNHHKGMHGHGRIIPHGKPQGVIVPQFEVEQQLQGHQGQQDDESNTPTGLPEHIEKIYEYIQKQIVDSVWVSRSANALAEGVVVNLSGELLSGSRFLVRKNQGKIEVTFYIKDDTFYTMAQDFDENLVHAIKSKCDANDVQIRYHRTDALGAQVATTSQPGDVNLESEDDDDLWGA